MNVSKKETRLLPRRGGHLVASRVGVELWVENSFASFPDLEKLGQVDGRKGFNTPRMSSLLYFRNEENQKISRPGGTGQ